MSSQRESSYLWQFWFVVKKLGRKKKSTYRKSYTFLNSVINSCVATQLGMEMAGDVWFLQSGFSKVQESMPFEPSCPQIRQVLQKERAWPVHKEKQSWASCSVSLSPVMQFRREAKLNIKMLPFVLVIGTFHMVWGVFLPLCINFSKIHFFCFSTNDLEGNLAWRNLCSLNS